MASPVRRRGIVAALLGAALGAAAWVLAPRVTGGQQPWDGGVRYLALLLIAGILVGLADARGVWPGVAGLYVGQALALVVHGAPPVADARNPQPLGAQLLFLASLTLAGMAGAAVAAAVVAWRRGGTPAASPVPGEPASRL